VKISRQEFLKALGLGTAVLGITPFSSLSSYVGTDSSREETGQAEASKKSSGRMKIKDIEIYYFDIPLTQPFRIAIGTVTAASDVLVRIITDSGLVGLGEASPFLLLPEKLRKPMSLRPATSEICSWVKILWLSKVISGK